jgi:hypothetical protein
MSYDRIGLFKELGSRVAIELLCNILLEGEVPNENVPAAVLSFLACWIKFFIVAGSAV